MYMELNIVLFLAFDPLSRRRDEIQLRSNLNETHCLITTVIRHHGFVWNDRCAETIYCETARKANKLSNPVEDASKLLKDIYKKVE
jgi:hypothetical protein